MATTFRRSSQMAATRIRQASWGRHVFWVLVISVTLAALVLFGSWAFHYRSLESAGRTDSPTIDQPG